MWAKLSIPAKFMIIAATSIIIGLAVIFGGIILEERARIETNAHTIATSELQSVRDLSVQTMTTRQDDSDDIGIRMYNAWFDRRNEDYDGKLWTVWSAKVAAFQEDMGAETKKPPLDAIDQEALTTGQTVGQLVGESYRLSVPVILGVTPGANQQVCFDCHEAMDQAEGEIISILSASVDLTEEYAALNQRIIVFILIWIVGVAGSIGMTYILLKYIVTRPLHAINGAMDGLAKGQLDTDIPGLTRHDDIGEMAQAVQIFKENLIKNRDMTKQQEAQQDAERARVQKLEQLTRDFEMQIGDVVQAVSTAAESMRHSAQDLATNAEQASGQAEVVSKSSDQAASSSEGAANATTDLAQSISEIEGKINSASSKAREGVDKAERTNETVAKLSAGAEQIGDVIDLINDIAERTNLLALNATVEAARAGEAGKGFAVVANEVQNLANQTKKATDSIGKEVQQVRTATTEAVNAIEAVASTINEIDEISSEVAAAVQEQNRATGEIANNVQQAANGTREMSSGISILSEAAANTDQGANSVLTSAEGLTQQADTLQNVVDQFITNVRET